MGRKEKGSFTPFCGQVQSQSNTLDSHPQPGTTMSVGSREPRPAVFPTTLHQVDGGAVLSQVPGKGLMGLCKQVMATLSPGTLAVIGEQCSQKDLPV